MHITDLKLQNFRLFKDTEITFVPGINVFFGENGQGKTTILEAVRFLSTTRSFLTDSSKEMVSFDSDYFFLRSRFIKKSFPHEIKFGWSEKSKKVSCNGHHLKVLSDLLGVMDTVLFIASDYDLVCGGPEAKRRYLDIQLSQADPGYLHSLKNYHRILKNRNALLKKKRYSKTEMETWSSALIRTGSAVILDRAKSVRDIERYAAGFLRILSTEKENLRIRYLSLTQAVSLVEIERHFRIALEKTEQKEKEMGYTMIGPHRDDLLFLLNEKEMKKYASRGQIKSASVSLKLAEKENLKNRKGVSPIFLIDDIFSDLDRVRRRQFIRLLEPGHQVIIGTTHHEELIRDMDPDQPVKTSKVILGRVA
ncbi:MAG: DNA replication/repair protein RecF [Candidatus Aureabacteria bacterium]|nr:DNA replication/repair protein RecF [Candidatus Auribacterota bacterium]